LLKSARNLEERREGKMLVDDLGEFVSRTRYEDLPAEIVGMAKTRVLDLLAAGLVGFRLGIYRSLYEILGGKGEATVWGEGVKYPLRDAVLLNSFMAHSTYLEDGSRFTGGHPSSVVIPAALTLGETMHAAGKDLILSVVLGYDIFIRLGKAIYPSTVVRGFQSTAVLGALGSAAACSSLLKSDEKGCKSSLAIACNLGVGLKDALKASGSQPIQVGRSCEGGLLSALYAKKGAPGSDTIFENGFLKAFADKPKQEEILHDLGKKYLLKETYLKIHGGCRGNHAPTDVILSLTKQHKIVANDIAEIAVKVDSVTMAAEIHQPKDGNQSQFSIPFSIAVAVVEGNASIYQFTDEKVRDPDIQSMMKRIRVEVDRSLDKDYPDKRGAFGEIILKDGRRFSCSLDNARGEPEDPPAPEEIEEKFVLLTKNILGQKTDRVVGKVRGLEAMRDVRELVDELRA
jgi:2-methylcitrate dehydratase PrpD